MGIIAYKKEVSPGVQKTFYMVVVEAINRYTGKRVQKKRRGIPSEPKAERIYRELWSACREERPDGVNFTHWGQFVGCYIEHLHSKVRSMENPNGLSPQVIRNKKSRLSHVDQWSNTHIDLVTPQFVTDELDKMELKSMSRSVTNHILKEIKCVFTYAFHMGAIKTNPFAGMKMRRMPKKRKEALTHEEVNRLLAEAKRRGHPYYHIWLLTVSLGLRRSELAGLKWLDIDFNQRLVYLRRQMIPREGLVAFLKDREERVVAIPAYVIPILKEMKLRSKSDFVIEVDCYQWRDGGQAKVLRDFCREIGIKEVTHHQLRATHITLALIDGVPLGIVKENVGHAKLSTTDEYFRSAGINMKGQTDGLRIQVPQDGEGVVLPLNAAR
jgi:integrase